MSPGPFVTAAREPIRTALARVWSLAGKTVRDARLAKQWTVEALAHKAGVSRDLVYAVERGEPSSLEALARLAAALGLWLEVDLMDPRRMREQPNKWADPVHSAMGEFEAGRIRPFGLTVGLDEPYQHYQFAGRGDVVAWDVPGGSFLHIENRTRFPNFQETAGTFNAKRAYLAPAIAETARCEPLALPDARDRCSMVVRDLAPSAAETRVVQSSLP